MQYLWWESQQHRATFIEHVRAIGWWPDVDVAGAPEKFIGDYREFGLFFYALSATGQPWRKSWVKDDEMDFIQLLADAGPWSSGERAMARLAVAMLDKEDANLYALLDSLDGSFWQVAQVAIAWRFSKQSQPHFESSRHLNDFYSLLTAQAPRHKDPGLRAAVYVLTSIGREVEIRLGLLQPADGNTRGMIQTDGHGMVTGRGRFDFGRLTESAAWDSFTLEEKGLCKLAHYLQDPSANVRPTDALFDLSPRYVRVATEAIQMRFGGLPDD